jgi:hypothetical protein
MKHLTALKPARLFPTMLGALLAIGTNTPAAIPPVEKLLPADTLLVIAVPDCARFREIWSHSPPSRFWNDPAMKPFHDKFVAKWKEEFVAPLERELGVKSDDYAALPQGLLTFAVTQNGWNGEDNQAPALLALLDTRDKSSQLRTNLVKLRKRWVDAGKPIRTEKIHEVEFSVVPLSTNDVPNALRKFFPQHQEVKELGKETDKKSAPRDELLVGQFESLLIVGSSTKAVEKVVLRLTGGSAPALADEPAFEASRLAVFRDAPVCGWCNAKAFFDVLLHEPPEKPNPEAPSPWPSLRPDKIITAIGLAGLKTIAFDFRDSNDGSLVELFFGVPEASRQGLFKILAAEAKESNPPPFVPTDAVRFQRWRLDGQKAWAALEKMLDDISPQAANALNFLISTANTAAQDKDPTYDLKKNLIGNLGDDIITYEKAPRAAAPAELAPPSSIMLIGSPNAEQLAAGLKGPLYILTPQAGTPEEREFLGRKISTVTMTGVPMSASPGAPHKLSYAASGGYVAISTDAPMLEEFLRSSESQAKALREMPGLAESAQKAGGTGGGLFGYENESENMRTLFESLKSNAGRATNSAPSFNPLTASIPFASPEKSLKEWMDFSLLPGFDKVAKYFSYTVYAGSANVDGLTYRLFAPVPPQLQK